MAVEYNEIYIFGGYNDRGFLSSKLLKMRVIPQEEVEYEGQRKRSFFGSIKGLKKNYFQAVNKMKDIAIRTKPKKIVSPSDSPPESPRSKIKAAVSKVTFKLRPQKRKVYSREV